MYGNDPNIGSLNRAQPWFWSVNPLLNVTALINPYIFDLTLVTNNGTRPPDLHICILCELAMENPISRAVPTAQLSLIYGHRHIHHLHFRSVRWPASTCVKSGPFFKACF